MNIAFFGSSLVSAYWNGAATYYRGLIRALHERGHRITFYESDAYNRQMHRDIDDPPYAKVVVYSARTSDEVKQCVAEARECDLIIKCSGNGVFDELLEQLVLTIKNSSNTVAFLDVDAPATLDRVSKAKRSPPSALLGTGLPSSGVSIDSAQDGPGEGVGDPFLSLVPQYDIILTYGGGEPVRSAYLALGAKECVPIYNALDPQTHHPVAADRRFEGDLALLANRLPDREARIDEFFFKTARALQEKKFLLGGSGWDDKAMAGNVKYLGHIYTKDHNALNCSPLAVLNVNRDSMAKYGFSPATRVFEAAGAGACVITDSFVGVETFFEPGEEILVAKDGDEVREILQSLTPEKAREIGRAAYRRALAEHTYAHRAALMEKALGWSKPIAKRPIYQTIGDWNWDYVPACRSEV